MIKEHSGINVTVNKEDLKKQGVIYLLEFPNGKVYIGQTIRKLMERISEHCKIKTGCVKLKNAMNKFKEFKVSVLEENLKIGQLNSFEPYYIKLFNSNGIDGYNLDSGGNNNLKSEETKNKMSESAKGKLFTKEHLINMSKRIKSIPDNIIFNSVEEASSYYKTSRKHLYRYYNGKIHTPSGQTFILLEE